MEEWCKVLVSLKGCSYQTLATHSQMRIILLTTLSIWVKRRWQVQDQDQQAVPARTGVKLGCPGTRMTVRVTVTDQSKPPSIQQGKAFSLYCYIVLCFAESFYWRCIVDTNFLLMYFCAWLWQCSFAIKRHL